MSTTVLSKKAVTAGVGVVALCAAAATGVAHAAPESKGPAGTRGPSSSQDAYLVPTQNGVQFTSVLTTGDMVGGYQMAGTPDGLGAYDNGDGTFTVLMAHEFGAAVGAPRAHGGTGSFISEWVVRKGSLKVLSGRDLMTKVFVPDGSGGWTQLQAPDSGLSFGRFCSADLPDVSAFYDHESGTGTRARIFMNGEETGPEGRAVGTVATGPDKGSAYVLPALGSFSRENSVAKPDSGSTTVVVGTDDSTGGQVYVYVGEKKKTGTEVDKAGLTGGVLYGLKVDGVATETDATTVAAGTRFSLVSLGDVSGTTGAQLQTDSVAAGVSSLNRPEDASWDPSDGRNLYFNTTASFTGVSRMWKLTFDDPEDVTKGGTVSVVAQSPTDTTQGPRMLDNLTVNDRGDVLAVEDVGNNPYLGGVWQLSAKTGRLARIGQADPARFDPANSGSPAFLTQDEEASGVIPVPFLGENAYLIDLQAHYSLPSPLVEGGQLMVMKVAPGKPFDGPDSEHGRPARGER